MDKAGLEAVVETVFAWWPSAVRCRPADILARRTEIEGWYERAIEPVALASGSRLAIQADWILYSTIAGRLQSEDEIRLDELDRSEIVKKLQQLVESHGMQQLKGTEAWDDSFDKAELAAYASGTLHSLWPCDDHSFGNSSA